MFNVAFIGELQVQPQIGIYYAIILILDLDACMTIADSAIKITSGFCHRVCIAAKYLPQDLIAVIPKLRSEMIASIRETCCRGS
jgi:hypothetical protein